MKPIRVRSIAATLAFLAVILLQLAVPSVASAARPSLQTLSLPESGAAGPITQAACTVGETRSSSTFVIGAYNEGDNHFVLVNPADCSACPNGNIQLNNVKFRSRGIAECSVVLEFSVVGASGGPACYVPDTTRVLCPPSVQTIAIVTTTTNYVLPLPGGCCIDQVAFLRVRVLQNTCQLYDPNAPELGHWPIVGIIPFAQCIACRSYWQYNGDGQLYGCDAYGNDQLSLDADCCSPVPAIPRSWGSVKTQYR